MLIHLIAVAIVAVLASPLARGAEFIPLEDECNGRQLTLKGAIEPGDYERFANHLARLVGGELPAVQDPDVLWTVKLDSSGGDVREAMRIGRLLRRTLATTEASYRYVRRPDGVYDFQRSGELVCLDGEDRLSGCHQDIVEAQCTGACLLVWLGGAERHANEGRLGVHGLAATDDAGEVRAYLAEMGVAPAWVERITTGRAEGDGWLSWSQRHELAGRADMVTSLIASCPAPLSGDESFRSVAAVDEGERTTLMDRAEAHRSCRRARLADARAPAVAWLAERHRAGAATAARANGQMH